MIEPVLYMKGMAHILRLLTLCLLTGCYHPVNLGHRAGGDVHKHLPENSLSCLEASIKSSLHDHHHFMYVELDVRETKDHQIVVCHDRCLRRTIKGARRRELVSSMTLEEVQSKGFKKNHEECIPTLDQFFDHAIACELKKPIVVEIKNVRTGQGVQNLIHAIERYLDVYGSSAEIVYVRHFDFPKRPVNVMCFSWNLPKKLLDPDWKEELHRVGIETVHGVMNHSNRLVVNN